MVIAHGCLASTVVMTAPMNTGGTDTGVIVTGTESAFFQQVAVNVEAVSNNWNFDAYALLPVGDTEQPLNWFTGAVHSIPTGLMLVISSRLMIFWVTTTNW